MGLDMYLSAEIYYGGWSHLPEEDRAKYKKTLMVLGIPESAVDLGSPSFTIDLNVGYWRKANHIHQWFVANVQNGVDDCGKYEVTREDLTTLRDACQQILETVEWDEEHEAAHRWDRKIKSMNTDLAKRLLPPQEGFFFGTYELDASYVSDLEDTIEIVDRCLNEPSLNVQKFPGRADFKYQSSW